MRHPRFLLPVALLQTLAAMCLAAFENPSFLCRSFLAGRASLASEGYVVEYHLGAANFAPELRLPVQLEYDSSRKRSGLLGWGWRCPQLESSASVGKDGLEWLTPWGETVVFAAQKDKAGKLLGYSAPFAPWRVVPAGSWDAAAASGTWRIEGSGRYRGWRFSYQNARLRSIASANGRQLDFLYDQAGRPLRIVESERALIKLDYDNGLAVAVWVNGVEFRLSYLLQRIDILPESIEGPEHVFTRLCLATLQCASLLPLEFSYNSSGFLVALRQGKEVEELEVEEQTAEERREQLAAIRDRKPYGGPVAGRLVADGRFRYRYPQERDVRAVECTDLAGRTATWRYSAKKGWLNAVGFDGSSRVYYYYMRHDVAYLGKLRKITDGEENTLAAFKYDHRTGDLLRTTDRLGNDTLFAYDETGGLAGVERLGRDDEASRALVRIRNNSRGQPVDIVPLGADGEPLESSVHVIYDHSAQPVQVRDVRGRTETRFGLFGYPTRFKDRFGLVTTVEYDDFNRPVSFIDPLGVLTCVSYTDFGTVAKVEKSLDGKVVGAVSVEYDGHGLPVAWTDQAGRTRRLERDASGRVVGETHPDGTSLAYVRDEIGRLVEVDDERGEKLRFAWNMYGLSSRTTAVGQLTEWLRDEHGNLAAILSSMDGHIDRAIRNSYDRFGRLSGTDYGNGQTEQLEYDQWGRVGRIARGTEGAKLSYDFQGRLVECAENGGAVYAYKYNDWGQRTERIIRTADGREFPETREYDNFGRLAKITTPEGTLEFRYNALNQLECQLVNGVPIHFTYDRLGRLEGKTLGADAAKPVARLRLYYGEDGQLAGVLRNGEMRWFAHDARGQLTEVRDDTGKVLEKYSYDLAGNLLAKTVGGLTTTFVYDAANQLVSSIDPRGKVTYYAYDAAGRLVREGERRYAYGWLDKVLEIEGPDGSRRYSYGLDGQLARATAPDGQSEEFLWDGLALVSRGSTQFLNEPFPTGGNPVLSSEAGILFNDHLGSTTGALRGGEFSPVAMTAFGDSADEQAFFTGKPFVDGLGYAFLLRNYRPDHGKWLTQDPLGYPDGWNDLAYCENRIDRAVDFIGAIEITLIQGYVLHDSGDPPNVFSDETQIVSRKYGSDNSAAIIYRHTSYVWKRVDTVIGGYSSIEMQYSTMSSLTETIINNYSSTLEQSISTKSSLLASIIDFLSLGVEIGKDFKSSITNSGSYMIAQSETSTLTVSQKLTVPYNCRGQIISYQLHEIQTYTMTYIPPSASGDPTPTPQNFVLNTYTLPKKNGPSFRTRIVE